MKVMVKRACGHEEQVEVFGSASERESKVKWYESTDCSACYSASKNSGCDEVEMSYAEYKNNFSSCGTKANSYNKSSKTIIVYVPKKAEEPSVSDEVSEHQITVEEIASAAGSTVETAKAMIAKSNEELENQYETLKDKLIQLNHPQKDQLLEKSRKAINMIYKYKAQ